MPYPHERKKKVAVKKMDPPRSERVALTEINKLKARRNTFIQAPGQGGHEYIYPGRETVEGPTAATIHRRRAAGAGIGATAGGLAGLLIGGPQYAAAGALGGGIVGLGAGNQSGWNKAQGAKSTLEIKGKHAKKHFGEQLKLASDEEDEED